MVGRAVLTMVWSSVARNMPSISPDMMIRIWRCENVGLDLVGARADSAGSWSGTSREGRREGRNDSVVTRPPGCGRWQASTPFALGDQPLEQFDQQGAVGFRPAGHRVSQRLQPQPARGFERLDARRRWA